MHVAAVSVRPTLELPLFHHRNADKVYHHGNEGCAGDGPPGDDGGAGADAHEERPPPEQHLTQICMHVYMRGEQACMHAQALIADRQMC